jgi:voltage-gated potassium channel
LGNAHEEGILESAGVVQASGLVTVLPSDGDNVFVTLTARELNPSMTIVSRAESLESVPKLKRAGATSVISPHAIGARRMASSLLNPAFIDFIEAAAEDEDLEVGEIKVPEGSPIVGRALSETGIRSRGEALIISVIRPKQKRVFNPPADFVLNANDCLLYVGTRGTAHRLHMLLSEADVSQEMPPLH